MQWVRWTDDLTNLREIKVERCFKPIAFGMFEKTQLHLFTDALREEYSSVAYLRNRLKDTTGRVHCSFVVG